MIREQKALTAMGVMLAVAIAAVSYKPVSDHFHEMAAKREQMRIAAEQKAAEERARREQQAAAERARREQQAAAERARREQQLERMVANDKAYIGGEGYTITDAKPRAMGLCTDAATITRSGEWNDGGTGLLYQVEKGGELYRVCFSHNNEAVTRARAVSLSADSTLQRLLSNDADYLKREGYSITSNGYEALGHCQNGGTKGVFNDNAGWQGANTGILYKLKDDNGTQYWACLSHGDNEQVKGAIASGIIDQAMLDRMTANDNGYLSHKGYHIVGNYEALGKCEDRGSGGVWNDQSGWKGPNTGIMYTISKSGQRFWACVSHRNENVIDVTAAPK